MERRTFLTASTAGLAGFAFGRPGETHAAPAGSSRGPAKSTILFFLCGGASHIDTWDMKPEAPLEYRGPFQPIATSAPGVRLSEHLPLLAKQAHHLAVINSVGGTVNTNDHHAGYYYNLTGHVPDQSFRTLGNNRTPFTEDWPFMGSVVAAKRDPHAYLPSAITLPHKPSRAPYTRPGQFAARLGVEYDPMYVQGSVDEPLKFNAPALVLQQGVDTSRLHSRKQLLDSIDATRRDFDLVERAQTWTSQQTRAFSLLGSAKTTEAFNVAGESEAVRERYGKTINGMNILASGALQQAR